MWSNRLIIILSIIAFSLAIATGVGIWVYRTKQIATSAALVGTTVENNASGTQQDDSATTSLEANPEALKMVSPYPTNTAAPTPTKKVIPTLRSSTPTPSPKKVDLKTLPLGDNKYSTSPKKGYVYSCMTSFNGGGAFTQGPWINASAGTWDLTKKVYVDGNVAWKNALFTITNQTSTRTLAGNDLPIYHNSGTYPIASTDDAYNYDRNPNSIAAQSITLTVPRNPTLLQTPQCVGGEVGITTSGVLLFNAFDAGGRDAVAMEVQDHCSGHPQSGSYYHYHGWSDCLKDISSISQHSDLVGFAFDGFGIFGLKGENGNELTSADLDECHGHTHTITWDGQQVSMYHYHMTHDFPYTVSWFLGQPAVKALSSGEGGGTGSNAGQRPPPGGRPPPRQ